MEASAAAQILFEVGAGLLIFAGLGHAVLTLHDVRRPTFFTPVSERVRREMEGPTIGFRRLFPGGDSPSTWRAWLGFNISHGLGIAVFALLILLLTAHDFEFVVDTGFMLPLVTGVCAIYLIVSLAFWFWVPSLMLAVVTACFAVGWALA